MPLPILSTPTYTATLSNGKEIKYRPYLVKEEKIMLMALESTDVKTKISAVLDLVESCTYDSFNVERAPLVDIMLMILKIRAKSVGETAKFRLRCKTEGCGEYTDAILDLSAVTPTERTNTTNKIQLTKETGISLRIPTIAEQMILDLKEDDIATKAIESLSLHIDSVFTAEETVSRADVTQEELVAFVENLTRQQVASIKEWIEGEPMISEDIKFTCKECEKESTVAITGFDDFFV